LSRRSLLHESYETHRFPIGQVRESRMIMRYTLRIAGPFAKYASKRERKGKGEEERERERKEKREREGGRGEERERERERS